MGLSMTQAGIQQTHAELMNVVHKTSVRVSDLVLVLSLSDLYVCMYMYLALFNDGKNLVTK